MSSAATRVKILSKNRSKGRILRPMQIQNSSQRHCQFYSAPHSSVLFGVTCRIQQSPLLNLIGAVLWRLLRTLGATFVAMRKRSALGVAESAFRRLCLCVSISVITLALLILVPLGIEVALS